MRSAKARRAAALVTVGLGALVSVSSAAAATTPFGCRASIGRAVPSSSVLPTVEPFVANNAGDPCVTDSSALPSATIGNAALGVSASVGSAGAFTYSTTSLDPVTGFAAGAASLASTYSASITTSFGTVKIGPSEAQAAYGCAGGAVVPTSSSTVGAITVNGSPIAIGNPSAEQTIALPGGATLKINETISTGTSLTRRVADLAIPNVGELVIAEAAVTRGATPCAGDAGSGVPPVLTPCPAGSSFDILAKICKIAGSDGQGSTAVSPPFQGPTGGKVLALSVARSLYKSKCLSGSGPAYAVVGTSKADRINGTGKADRIIGLGGNDRLAGLAGKDCLDGGAGADKLFEGNGKGRRVYGGAGADRIQTGNGAASIYGGAGNDRIQTGNGAEHVWGGAGNDRINAGLGPVRVHGGAGHDRLYAPSQAGRVDCGAGGGTAFVNRVEKRYAKAHRCSPVHVIP